MVPLLGLYVIVASPGYTLFLRFTFMNIGTRTASAVNAHIVELASVLIVIIMLLPAIFLEIDRCKM